jgi:hypothetical protein
MLITDFTEDGSEGAWRVVNDDVMGGRSTGSARVTDAGTLVFAGRTDTRGGGFSSVRVPLDATRGAGGLDLGAASGLAVRYRSDGRGYELDVRTGERVGRMKVAYRAPLTTAPARVTDDGDGWHVARVPFDAFRASARGQRLDRTLDASAIRAVGFFLYDKKDGPFHLEVDAIESI